MKTTDNGSYPDSISLVNINEGIQAATAKDLPDEASETGNKQNNCGGSNEVKIPFDDPGTDVGRLTGEFNSEENDHDDPSTHENWSPIPSECRNND